MQKISDVFTQALLTDAAHVDYLMEERGSVDLLDKRLFPKLGDLITDGEHLCAQ
jgi:hypothetical protein